jgi:hypothetical protein
MKLEITDMLDGIVHMHRLVLDGGEHKYFQ